MAKQHILVLDTKVFGKTGIGIFQFLHHQIHDRPDLANHCFGDIAFYNTKKIASGTLICTTVFDSHINSIDVNSMYAIYGSYGRRFIKKNPQWFNVLDGSSKSGYRFCLNSKLYKFLLAQAELLEMAS